MKKFCRQFEHTSDLGIEVNGSSMILLFKNAVVCLFDLITDLKKVEPVSHRQIEIKEEDAALLLREMLAELLYLFHGESFITRRIEITEMNDTHLKADLIGEPFNPKKHEIFREIKSVTYHLLAIKHMETGFKARFVLDI